MARLDTYVPRNQAVAEVPLLRKQGRRGSSRTRQDSPRILHFGWLGSGNFGNDVSLAVLASEIACHVPTATQSCVTVPPGRLSAECGVREEPLYDYRDARFGGLLPRGLRSGAVALLRIWREIARCGRYDVVVVPGSGVLEGEFGSQAAGLPVALLRLAIACRLTRTPLAFVGVGVSPLGSSLTRVVARLSLQLAQYRTYRDEFSRTQAIAMGVRAHADPVFTDLVWSFTPEALKQDDAPSRRRRAVFGVMALHFDDDGEGSRIVGVQEAYESALADAAARLGAEGMEVDFVVGDVEDLESAERVRALASQSTDLEPDLYRGVGGRDYFTVQARIRGAVVCVASRYHTMLAALQVGVPVVCVGYGPKFESLAERFGLAGFATRSDRLESAWLAQAAEQAAADPAFRQVVQEAARRESMVGQAHMDHFFEWLGLGVADRAGGSSMRSDPRIAHLEQW